MLPPPVELRIPDAPFLHEEHFPGAPCVPGSCLLEAVRRAAVQAFGRPVLCMAQARFRHFVLPGSRCRLYWKPSRIPACPVSGTDAVASSRRVGWQLAAVPADGRVSGSRLAEGELWLAPGNEEQSCD